MKRSPTIPLVLAACSYVLALVQRPGLLAADTKIDMHVDPTGFFADVVAGWAQSGGPGQVQAGQYSGYLWPMLPFHAAGDLIGLAPWVTQRLWLGTLLAVAAWGMVRLLDALLGDRPRGVSHAVAGAILVLNPYVVTFANRTSFTLLAYALLPWLLLCVHRGVRAQRPWWWAALLALLVASLGGGINAAVAGWVLVAPAALIVYDLAFGDVRPRAVIRFLAWALPFALVASVWWLMPVFVQVSYGSPFLAFTETAGAIWNDTSLSESLRLMGFWVSYVGLGYGPIRVAALDSSATMLFSPAVVAAGFLAPALAFAGFAWTRRWRYGPFFVLLALLGLVVMFTGFPVGTPFRRALEGAYYRVEAVQFMRTTYKAAPLLVIAVAALGGVAAGRVSERLAARRAVRAALAVAGVAALAVASWPLVTGRAIDRSIAFERVPADWTGAAAEVDRTLPRGTRAAVLPAQVFPYYRWGFPQDAILPALTDRPVAVRGAVPYADLRGVDLLWTADALVQQRRVLPGQLAPLLRLLAVGAVVNASDDDQNLSGAIDARAGRREVREGLPGGPERAWRRGAVRGQVVPARDRGSLVSVLPLRAPTVVDGSATTLASLASLGALAPDRLLRYGADMTPGEVRAGARAGGEIVVGDGNRRQVFVASRPRQSVGATLAAADDVPGDGAIMDPFAGGQDDQTVAVLGGARSIQAPFSPSAPQFPEHRPYAAFDGDPTTYWVADRNLDEPRHWIEIDLGRPRDVPTMTITPQRETSTRVQSVLVNGRPHALGTGPTRVRAGLRGVRRIRIAIGDRRLVPPGREQGPGALAEVDIPGVRVVERLRPPVRSERALAGRDLSRASLSYLFERTTGDNPRRRSRAQDPDAASRARSRGRSVEQALVAAAGDGERRIRRRIDLPAARSFAADGWASVSPHAPDSAVDSLVGADTPARFDSRQRWKGRPGLRASNAFDGDPRTAWVSGRRPQRPLLRWVTPRPRRVEAMRLVAAARGATPTRLLVRADGRRVGEVAVGPGGLVRLPRPVRARSFAVEVVGDRGGGAVVAVAELRVPGLGTARVPRRGALRAACGALGVRAGPARARMRPVGTVAALDAGRPIRAKPCGARAALPAGPVDVDAEGAVMRADVLRLRSRAPDPAPAVAAPGRVVDPGGDGRGRRTATLALREGAWVVLGEGYGRGWTASCDGRDLGAPAPVNGYANGWRVDRSCRRVEFTFEPQKLMEAGYAISGIGVLGLLGLVGLGGLRGAARVRPAPRPWLRPAPVSRWPLFRAAVVGALAGIAGAGLFALRTGPLIALAVGLVLWRGVGARGLALAAGALAGVVLPVVYVMFPPDDRGGYNQDYANEILGGHWVAVAVWVLMALAVSRAIPRSPADGPEDAGAPRAAP